MDFVRWAEEINSAVNGWVWSLWTAGAILLVGVILSFRTGFIQFQKFGYIMRSTIGSIFSKRRAGSGEVTPFQAMTTALAGTVGTGNIVGVTGAVIAGGPGVVFWLWVSGFIGMCTKFSEVVLSVKYRERNADGDWVGGPMYYIKNGLGKGWNWLGSAFCVFGVLASFGIGCAAQMQAITSSMNSAIQAFEPAAAAVSGKISLTVGIVIAGLTAIILLGGVKRIGRVNEKLVPFMAAVYIAAAMVVIIANAEKLGGVLSGIFAGAFEPSAVVGGAAGITFKTVVTKGVGRGVFSNEAGLGSAGIAHAASSEKNPVRQGLYGVCEVFVDTIVICTVTALAILLGCRDIAFGTAAGAAEAIEAFSGVLGPKVGSMIIAAGLTLFASSTIFSWSLYGTRCVEFLVGSERKTPVRLYKVLFVAMTVCGSVMGNSFAWNLSETFNGLMAMPNLIALLLLSGTVGRETKLFFMKKHREK